MSILDKLNSTTASRPELNEVELMIQGGAMIFLPAVDTADEAVSKIKALYPEATISSAPPAIVIDDNAAIEIDDRDLVLSNPDSLYDYQDGTFAKMDGKEFIEYTAILTQLSDLVKKGM